MTRRVGSSNLYVQKEKRSRFHREARARHACAVVPIVIFPEAVFTQTSPPGHPVLKKLALVATGAVLLNAHAQREP